MEYTIKPERCYGLLCESDGGVTVFGKPIGEQILLEQVGHLTYSGAVEKAEQLNNSGRWVGLLLSSLCR